MNCSYYLTVAVAINTLNHDPEEYDDVKYLYTYKFVHTFSAT